MDFDNLYNELQNESNLQSFADNIREIDICLSELAKNYQKANIRKTLKLICHLIKSLGIPIILIINDSQLLKNIIESIKKENLQQKSSFFEVLRSEVLTRVLKCDLLTPKIEKFNELFSFKNIYSEPFVPNNLIELSEFENLYISILLKLKKVVDETKEIEKYRKFKDYEKIKINFDYLNDIDIASYMINEKYSHLEIKALSPLNIYLEELKSGLIKKEPCLLKEPNLEFNSTPKDLKSYKCFTLNETIEVNHDLENEFIPDFNTYIDFEDIKKTICAFLNSKGGRIYIGFKNNAVKGVFLKKNDQDQFKRDIDELLKGFHPKVDSKECRTWFLPIQNGNPKKEMFIIKIIVKQGVKNDVYFTKEQKVYLRTENGLNKHILGYDAMSLIKERQNVKAYDSDRDEKFNDPDPDEIQDIVENKNYEKKIKIDSLPFFDNKKIIDENIFKKDFFKENQNINESNKVFVEKQLKEFLSIKPKETIIGNNLSNILKLYADININEKDFFDIAKTFVLTYNEIADHNIENIYFYKQKRLLYVELNYSIVSKIFEHLNNIYSGAPNLFFKCCPKEEFQKFKEKYII